jgi:hypothetical protein
MKESYAVPALSSEEVESLARVYNDLMELSGSEVPSVRCAARAALAQIAQARNGQGLGYELYTSNLSD